MSEVSAGGLGGEFLDDFYAECDEQLTAIREALVSLESSIGNQDPDPAAIEKLFRNFHSFKGNCAMVGLRPGENLAHAAEDLLRAVTRNRLKLTVEGLDLLMSAAQRLEQVAAGHREHKPLPEVESLVAHFGKLCQATPSSRESPAPGPAAEAIEAIHARPKGHALWRFRFRPTRELDAQGINVNAVRERLLSLGEILQAKPHVKGDSVEFEFLAALKEAPDAAAWERDGITSEMLEAAGPAGVVSRPAGDGSNVESSAGPFVAPSHVVRVDLGRLDELMRITGEMVIHRARLEDLISKISARNTAIDARSLQEVNVSLGRSLRELREGIMRVRLVPVAEIFSRLPFVVRDLARETGRKVQLTFSGQETEIDKFIVERLKDPLLHLVRNAISHGIELPAERLAAGKPETATLSFRASTVGDSVLIEVGDDGRGVDRDAVREKANENGLPVPPVLSDNALLDLICAPGFSTRSEADRASGRGVGMTAVQSTVRELGGTLSLETDEHGTRFSLRLPLTLAIADVFIVSAGEQTCAVPQTFVQEIVQMDNAQMRRVSNAEIIPYRDGVLPLVRLRSIFGMDAGAKTNPPVLVLTSERGMIGLAVDHVHGQREVVVQVLRDPLVQVPGVSGATELGNGKPVLILDAASLTSGVSRPLQEGERAGARPSSIAITD
jgi:two-component system chemotaxis sensor kinase CheA